MDSDDSRSCTTWVIYDKAQTNCDYVCILFRKPFFYFLLPVVFCLNKAELPVIVAKPICSAVSYCRIAVASPGYTNIFRVTGPLCGVTGEFPSQRRVTRLNKRSSKQSWAGSSWRHCNEVPSCCIMRMTAPCYYLNQCCNANQVCFDKKI